MAKTRSISADSARAVAVAGTRRRRAPVSSAGTWNGPGKLEDGPFRPGKTARERRRS